MVTTSASRSSSGQLSALEKHCSEQSAVQQQKQNYLESNNEPVGGKRIGNIKY